MIMTNIAKQAESRYVKNEICVRANIDKEIKIEAEKTLKAMGLNISDFIRLSFIRLVNEQEFSFHVRLPNATTQKAIHEAKEMIQQKHYKPKTKQALLDELDTFE